MKYALVASLNLIPGFGLGYLATGRRGAFRKSLVFWAVGMGVGTCLGGLAGAVMLQPEETVILGAYILGVVLVGVPTTINLLLSGLARGDLRVGPFDLLIVVGATLWSLGMFYTGRGFPSSGVSQDIYNVIANLSIPLGLVVFVHFGVGVLALGGTLRRVSSRLLANMLPLFSAVVLAAGLISTAIGMVSIVLLIIALLSVGFVISAGTIREKS